MSYKIKLEIFEGPLDLLLYLIKKDEINVYDIPITTILEQYMQYLELMRMLDLNVAGEFIVMAATLMHIKSKMLLPQEVNLEEDIPEDERDPRAELVKRLLEYQQFKEAADALRAKERARQDIFKRQPVLEDKESGESYFEASLFDLINAFSKALKDVPKELFYEVIKDEFTVEGKVHDLLHMIAQTPHIKLTRLFERAKSKLEAIATFLAVLELIRLKEIIVVQKNVFGEIEVFRNKANIEPQVSPEVQAAPEAS
ncbi:segregation and condensation protein A [Candidatus Velamenicoccus archaeovorus]|uniref:Segregation and condensation protein A n=1 Tax=Velamenicoccus archaeovorus TaxID=1930593 RepID=A0A410P2X0_VELA1|nr:segregation/condensation protein A [Candidatus Velamenicoccus archaeovorus]QAT16441.1 segregation and condensation protein A [Candidatus Velamenicoccus archaeovorus]